MKRDTRSAYRARAAKTEREIDEAVAAVAAERKAEWDALRARVAAEKVARHKFTRDELDGATAVRTETGWHRVVRVNAKSVTVATPYSWTDRYRIDQVLEVRT